MEDRARAIRNGASTGAAADSAVAEEVSRVLASTGRFARDQVKVSASGGTVTLQGRVSSYFQKQVAQMAASTAIGGRRLINEVEVV